MRSVVMHPTLGPGADARAEFAYLDGSGRSQVTFGFAPM